MSSGSGWGRPQPSEELLAVSLSLVTGNGVCALRSDDGWSQEFELDLEDARAVDQWLRSARVALAANADAPSVVRPVFYFMASELRLFVPFTLEPTSQADFGVMQCREGWWESPGHAWYGVEDSIASHAQAAARDGRELLLQAPDHELGVAVSMDRDTTGRPVVVVTSSRALNTHDVWRRAAPHRGGFALVGPAPADAASWRAAGQLAVIAFREVGAHPLEVFPSYYLRARGGAHVEPRTDRMEGAAGPRATSRNRGSGPMIEALHIPAVAQEAVRQVTIDRRDATRWYHLVSGGPVESVELSRLGVPGHELYVNSRYANLPPTAVNDRATVLLRHCGIPMNLDEIRGDALIVRGPGSKGYPRSADPALIEALSDALSS